MDPFIDAVRFLLSDKVKYGDAVQSPTAQYHLDKIDEEIADHNATKVGDQPAAEVPAVGNTEGDTSGVNGKYPA
jgi:hypothetical protein